MRTFLAVLAVVALAAVPAYAITFTGSISDWDPSLIRTNNITTWPTDNRINGSGTLDILSYGAYKDATTFYGFVQTADPVGTDADGWGGAGGYRCYPSAYINIDDDNWATQVGNLYQSGNTLPPGVDVDIEYDMDDFTPGLNFWGPPNNDNGNSWIPVAGGVAVHSADGTMFEFSAPISSILASVAAPNGDGAIAHADWTITMGGEAAPSYGRELGGPFATPEPGTIAMLIGAGLAAIGYALRRRK